MKMKIILASIRNITIQNSRSWKLLAFLFKEILNETGSVDIARFIMCPFRVYEISLCVR